ncbi:MAG: nitroreductase [Defluviitaleaceae bacterium]|nr:nitroreductase [Defluviitaleaceae bacterium]
MNEILKNIAARYSCRAYDGRPVEKEKLDAIATAALQSPSAMNLQPWEIVIITDKSMIDTMDASTMQELEAREDKSMYERIMSRGGKIFYNAPCMFVVIKKPIGNHATLDCGIVSQNIALAASSLGLGNVICAMANIPLMGTRGEEFKQKIGITQDLEFGMAVLVGYEAQTGGKSHEIDSSKVRFVE